VTLDSLLSDPLGSNSVALNDTGQVIGLEHYSPYGTVDYQWGSMPTSFTYAGERLDSQTGLLYDNFRYYDPLTGRFVRADNVQDNSNGMDPYAYVGDNPETRNDPSGHCWPWCTALIGAVLGAAISVGVTLVSDAVQHKAPSLGEVAQSAVAGAVSGAIVGVTGPGAGLVSAIGIGALSGAAGNVAGKAVSNAITGKPLTDGLLDAGIDGAISGGLTAGLLKGGSLFLNRFAGKALTGVRAILVDGIRRLTTPVGDFSDIAGSNPLLSTLRARLPSSASQPFGPGIVDGFSPSRAIPRGFRWGWIDESGNYCVFYCHDINARAPAGSNSSLGWTARFNQSSTPTLDPNGWMDTSGNFPPNGYRLNETHWPMRIS
jgi:RHS repeat-associated protein